MLANNNQQVISRMAKRSLKSNRRRSLIMITAVVLSSFMMFAVMTVGVTYFKMQHMQNIRMHGADYDAIMYGVTEEQQKMCEENPDITETGILAIAGYVVETQEDKTPNVGLIWTDDSCWDIMMDPARAWMQGEYPQEVEEVMASKEALKECGFDHLGVGDTFTMKYSDATGDYTKEFRISGMWGGFGEKKAFYVSKAFYQQSGRELSDVSSGRYFMEFKQRIMTHKQQETFINSLNLGKQQNIFFMEDVGASVEILTGIIGLILVTCLCAYLLIYNIMYLSISGNIRYYGLLQTIGMTARQMNKLMVKQMLFVGILGIIGGITLGIGVSFFLIPTVVKSLGRFAIDVEVAFHPVIFLLAIALTGLTVYIGSRKPVKLAIAIAPIEAMGYRAAAGKKSSKKTAKGKLLCRMAREQLTQDKKKSGIIILSLAASLSVFLCMMTLLDSQGARTFYSNYMEMDMVVKNDTLKREDRKDWTQIIDDKFLVTARNNDAVKEINPMISAEITVPWEPEFSDIWMREFYDTWMSTPYEDDIQEYKEHPENFGSFIIGISEREFEYLNTAMSEPMDKEKFLEGKTCILYRNDLDFQTEDFSGKKVTCAEYGDAGNTRTFEIAGLTNETYYAGALIGQPPTIIVSDSVVKGFVKEPFVYKVGILYENDYDDKVEEGLLALMDASPYAKDFSYDSKIEAAEKMEKAQAGMMEAGIGIVLILAFIGIMNYVNTVTGNIQNRQVELSILESVGMTEKQVNKMLAMEGFLFAAGSLLVTATVGVGITHYLYQTMNYRGIPFSIPILPMAAMVLFIFFICVVIPLAIRRVWVKKRSVVERIHGGE